MPPQPQGASLHGWISAVWFGSVGGDEFDFGWGADPQTPEIVYFCVFSTIYTIYLTLTETNFTTVKKQFLNCKQAFGLETGNDLGPYDLAWNQNEFGLLSLARGRGGLGSTRGRDGVGGQTGPGSRV